MAMSIVDTIVRINESAKGESAQITIDYLTGMTIFLLSMVFVFQFMSNLFVPFQSGSDEVTLAADRASMMIVEQMLNDGSPMANSVIDQGKLYRFNNTRLNHSDQTAYNDALREIGLFSQEMVFDLNISVSYLNGSPMNQSGPPLPENMDIGQTRRVVLIYNSSTGYNETAMISVRVW